MTFRHFGTVFRTDIGGDPVEVHAGAPKRSTIYLSKPRHVAVRIGNSDAAPSLGMSSWQARSVAALLLRAADWCDSQGPDNAV